jgi:hypothetical protein
MGIAKRLYVYAVSSISLLVLSVGLYNLLAVALGEIADVLGASVVGGESSGREQLSLAIALVVVGAPVFAIHWWLVGRGWSGTDPSAADDRHSAIRAFHMGLVATVALGIVAFAAIHLVDLGFRLVLGSIEGDGRLTDDLAMILVAAPVWWFHMTRRNADLRHDRLRGGAAWLTRLHRYGWAFTGLMILLVGASQIIGTLSSALIGRSEFGQGQDWWRGSLAWSLAAVVTGSGIWWLHIDDARRAIRDADLIGEDDRSTALRMTYFEAALLVALGSAGLTVASSITELGRLLLGVGDGSGMTAFLESVVGPILVAVPFVLAGWLHWRALHEEATERGAGSLAAAGRSGLHLAAIIGIVFLAVGFARLGGLLLEQVLGGVGSEVGGGSEAFFRAELVWCVAQIVVGALLWLPSWSAILRRRTADPALERVATTGRAYLFLIVAGGLIAGVPSAVFALFKLINALLGGAGTALGADLPLPTAVVVVAAVVATYHGRLVVSDLRLGPLAGAISADAVASPVTLALVLRGQSGDDLEAVAADLREHLPPGVVLEGG